MLWFEKLMGFAEAGCDDVRKYISYENERLMSKVNGRSYVCGRLEIPTLGKLEETSLPQMALIRVSQIVADVKDLHAEPSNANAMFQAASQFNLLEMMNPDVAPEAGVGIYAYDHTQGPACAIACGAGTIYRNYFVPLGRQIGQSAHLQVDCLADMQAYFGENLWTMRNGYAIASAAQLAKIGEKIAQFGPAERKAAKSKLRIGLQLDTEVTLAGGGHRVSQAYCSALPVAYSSQPEKLWEAWARLILEATYEATFWAAIRNLKATGCDKLYLTLVGGGAFGNPNAWIFDALGRVLKYFKYAGLDVYFVSYGQRNAALDDFIADLEI